MTPTKKKPDSILVKEAIGFSTIILLAWVVETAELPHLLFGEPAVFNWPRVLVRTVVVLGIWLWVHLATRKVLKRLHYLEEFLLVCGWCRKVGHEGQWLTTEEYFGSKFATETSHGICPECARQQFAGHRAVTRVDVGKMENPPG
jgi:hypothetical protein